MLCFQFLELNRLLDFVIIEASSHEGETLARNVFGSDSMRDLLFGELKPQIFTELNAHVTMPLAAYEPVMTTLFGAEVLN